MFRVKTGICSNSISTKIKPNVNLPLACPASRSLIVWETSTADTLTEKREPVLSFCSLMPLNNQETAHGMTPRDPSGLPSMVWDLPMRASKYHFIQTSNSSI